MDVAFRMAQWRITSGVQCTFVSADHSFITLRLKFNKVHSVLYFRMSSGRQADQRPVSGNVSHCFIKFAAFLGRGAGEKRTGGASGKGLWLGLCERMLVVV